MKASRGFTLIELLVVLLIIGITTGIAVVSLTQNHRQLPYTVATGLAHELRLASLESLLRPATLSLVLTHCGWQFQRFDETAKPRPLWRPLHAPALPDKCLPKGIYLRLKAPGHRIILAAGGDLSPFVILIYQKKSTQAAQITGHANGEIKVRTVHAP